MKGRLAPATALYPCDCREMFFTLMTLFLIYTRVSEEEFFSGSFPSVKVPWFVIHFRKTRVVEKKSCFELCGDEIQ